MCHEGLTAPVSGGAGIVEERVETPGEERTIPGFLARPEEGRAPAVLVVHDVWGANDFYHDFARRLAGEGFAALLPDFFVREGPVPAGDREAVMARRARHSQVRCLVDIAGALTWLREHPATTGKVGTIGFCMGGTLVFLAAAREPVPEATVAFYGFPKGQKTELAPLNPIDEAAQVRSPLLGLWGDEDHGVGMENVEAYRQELAAAGVEHDFVIYPGLPHGFMTFGPDKPGYDDAQDAWRRAVEFLRARLTA